ncbi:MAG: PrsW family intramembrane metalloprotease [Streptosporangiales bacterium]|nr:PrsW family intramembrane metalloprotease [Streptosporangiales bacterium]
MHEAPPPSAGDSAAGEFERLPPRPPQRRAAHRQWLSILGIGLPLWVLAVVVTFATANTTLLPTVILLGSFLVPVTFVVWAYGHGHAEDVGVELLFHGFVVGGVLGVAGASLLETYLLNPSPWIYVGVGLIEEGVKALALVWVARRMTRRTVRDGLVLGATVGFGFAALESAGYAMNAMFTRQGLSLSALVETEILRGLLTPVGHGLWTAIIGGLLFAAWGDRRLPRVTGGVIVGYLGVALLHALWDSMHGLAIVATLLLTGEPWQYLLLRVGRLPGATPGQQHLITFLDWGGLILISVIALAWLRALVVGDRVRRKGAAAAT